MLPLLAIKQLIKINIYIYICLITSSWRRLQGLTRLLEDISTAADLAQQLTVGDGHVVVRWIPLPSKHDTRRESFMHPQTCVKSWKFCEFMGEITCSCNWWVYFGFGCLSGQLFGKLCGTVFHRAAGCKEECLWCGTEASTQQEYENKYMTGSSGIND